jgi:predicted alpha-1,2-mannosidase
MVRGRRPLVFVITISSLVAAVACGGDDDADDDDDVEADAAVPLPEVEDPLDWIDPTIGTGGIGFSYGSAFVGAAVPHGLVKVGPDTRGPFGTVGFQHFSGYWAGDDRIQGFSHLHLHGAGVADFGVVSVMPTVAFDPALTSVVDYEAGFAKADEVARPGSYRVAMDTGITVEMVATVHGAHHWIDFAGAGGAEGQVVLDLAKVLDGGTIDDAEVHLDPEGRTFTARLHHRGGMSGSYGGYALYVAGQTRQAWVGHQVWSGGADAADGTDASGAEVGAVLRFATDEPVELQLAVSLVSADGAAANLAAELPAWDLAATRAAAEDAWRARTEVVKVTGGTAAQRRIFYTGLYHAFLMPTVIADADGTYQLVGATPAQADGWRMMSDASLWDTYRTVHPLYAWLAPASARDAARSLVAMAEGLGAFPRWPIAIGESGTMLGASAEIVIADAVARGIDAGDVGAETAWPILRAAAMDAVAPAGGRGGRDSVEPYMTYGWVPSTVGRSVSHTTEYAHDDFALADLAARLGHAADATLLLERSHGWRGLYDAEVGFLRARNPDGSFADPEDFDPLELGDDYAEANAWHSLWMAGAHDADGLAALLGGREAAVAKLETFFEEARLDWDDGEGPAFPRPYYWHGNEPDINAPFLFAQLGRPDLTQRWARWVIDTVYTDGPDGLAGNDDGGTLGSWYVFAALGLYPVPGSDRYILGAPLFPQARVVVDGRELVIVGEGVSDENLYVQRVTLDGEVVDAAELTHGELVGAAELRFVMGPAPAPAP